jgi:putative transposase
MSAAIFRSILLSYIRPVAQTGRPRALSPDQLIDSISYVLRTGCQWRQLHPPGGVSWQCVYAWFRHMSKTHVFENAYNDLLRFYADRHGISQQIITDTTFVKNVYGRDCVGRSYYDRGRKATKVSALVDVHGIPIQLLFHPANKYDGKTLHHLMQTAGRRVSLEGRTIYGDRAYDSERCRDVVTRHKAQQRFVRKRASIDKAANRTRVVVEHTFGWIDKYRRIIMRYDARVSHFRSFHYLACFHLLTNRVLKPPRRK